MSNHRWAVIGQCKYKEITKGMTITGKPNVLTIDGDAAYQRMLKSVLSDEGYPPSCIKKMADN
jgi:hypothetical protein